MYTDDTRFLSHHELRLNGRKLRPIATSRLSFRHGRWVYTTDTDGQEDPTTVSVTLDRVISERRLHEDIVVHRTLARGATGRYNGPNVDK